ncbi:uncharacterized protein LOC111895283 [Lactuca sativa]|uniref:uncharacterized protein LOC111895283 n=1 Tax=Lactuca sativa TaxID=4236 RepID=UPI000CD9F0DF|nr:uncharacterized protein LOC111895283 [Lactuca sativa]
MESVIEGLWLLSASMALFQDIEDVGGGNICQIGLMLLKCMMIIKRKNELHEDSMYDFYTLQVAHVIYSCKFGMPYIDYQSFCRYFDQGMDVR